MYKGINLLFLNDQGIQEIINTVYIKEGALYTHPLNNSYINAEIDDLIKAPLFLQDPSNPKMVDPKNEPELFLQALRLRYNSTYYRFSEIENIDEEIIQK